MADEPDDLTLRLLREIRTGQSELGATVGELREKLDRMNERSDELHETVYTATGFATHAHIRSEAAEKRMDRFEARLKKLEEKA